MARSGAADGVASDEGRHRGAAAGRLGVAYELKWDGMRRMAEVDGGSLRMVTSNGRDATLRLPELAGLGAPTVGVDAVLDGKVVAHDEHGGPTLTVRTQTPQKYCGVDPVEVPLDPQKG